eukprot:1195699-Prorocentrum_minimum.AAC.2
MGGFKATGGSLVKWRRRKWASTPTADRESRKGLWGVECILAVTGTGGPVGVDHDHLLAFVISQRCKMAATQEAERESTAVDRIRAWHTLDQMLQEIHVAIRPANADAISAELSDLANDLSSYPCCIGFQAYLNARAALLCWHNR